MKRAVRLAWCYSLRILLCGSLADGFGDHVQASGSAFDISAIEDQSDSELTRAVCDSAYVLSSPLRGRFNALRPDTYLLAHFDRSLVDLQATEVLLRQMRSHQSISGRSVAIVSLNLRSRLR